MANKDILQYLRETPHNTNVNVVKGMIGNGSGSGTIEMETVFEDDISLTYEDNSPYAPSTGTYIGNISIAGINGGILRLTYENNVLFVAPNNNSFDTSKSISNSELPFTYINMNNSGLTDSFRFQVQSGGSEEQELNLPTYCQTPHHLKIELFDL